MGVPAHWSVHLQLPAPLLHSVFVQHWMPFGSKGQNPGVEWPPDEEQLAVETHTPGMPFTSQRPLGKAWAVAKRRREVIARNFIIGMNEFEGFKRVGRSLWRGR